MTSTSRKRLAWQLAVALVICAPEARAGSPSAARERLVTQANVAVDEGRFADSRSAWLAVWKLERSQVAACNIGALSLRIGEAPTAVRWLSLCKEIMRQPTTAQERKVFESRIFDLAAARQLVGEIHVRAPAGAMLTIDGDPVDWESVNPIPVTPGRHVVRAQLDGQTSEIEVNVPRGEKRDVKLSIAAASPRAAPASSKDLRAGAARPPPSQSGPHMALVLGGVVSSAVFFALGGGLLAVSDGAEDDMTTVAKSASPNGCYRLTSPGCYKALQFEEDMHRANEAATTSFLVGGALAAATLVYTVLPRRRVEITASARGITVRGVW